MHTLRGNHSSLPVYVSVCFNHRYIYLHVHNKLSFRLVKADQGNNIYMYSAGGYWTHPLQAAVEVVELQKVLNDLSMAHPHSKGNGRVGSLIGQGEK